MMNAGSGLALLSPQGAAFRFLFLLPKHKDATSPFLKISGLLSPVSIKFYNKKLTEICSEIKWVFSVCIVY
jgi:hypothetical protein